MKSVFTSKAFENLLRLKYQEKKTIKNLLFVYLILRLDWLNDWLTDKRMMYVCTIDKPNELFSVLYPKSLRNTDVFTFISICTTDVLIAIIIYLEVCIWCVRCTEHSTARIISTESWLWFCKIKLNIDEFYDVFKDTYQSWYDFGKWTMTKFKKLPNLLTQRWNKMKN